jgi:ribosomal protein S18 acetylase RimI-like enzyme
MSRSWDSRDTEGIERATMAAVAPPELEEVRGWLVGYDEGTVGRAKSAVPLHHDGSDVRVVADIRQRYLARGLAPMFRVPQLAPFAAVEAELARMGLQSQQPTGVHVARAADVARAGDSDDVLVTSAPGDDWASVFLGEGFDVKDGASRVRTLTRAPGSLFAGIRDGGQTVAAGVLATGHGWASIHGMRTAQSHRGRGLATRILSALARQAQQRGFENIVLQVETANTIARRLYAHCGFEHAWTYAYWRTA